MAFFKQSLERIDRRFDPAVDKAEWLLFLQAYMAQPKDARMAAFDKALGLGGVFDKAALSKRLDRFYQRTSPNPIPPNVSP